MESMISISCGAMVGFLIVFVRRNKMEQEKSFGESFRWGVKGLRDS